MKLILDIDNCKDCPFNFFDDNWLDFKCYLYNEFIPSENIKEEWKGNFPYFCDLENYEFNK